MIDSGSNPEQSPKNSNSQSVFKNVNVGGNITTRDLFQVIVQVFNPIQSDLSESIFKELTAHFPRLQDFAEKHFKKQIGEDREVIKLQGIIGNYQLLESIHRALEVNQDDNNEFTAFDAIDRNDLKLLYFHAPGGSGKTTFLLEMLIESINIKKIPFYLDISRFDLVNNREETSKRGSENTLQDIFNQCTLGGNYKVFEKAHNNFAKTRQWEPVVFWDGLNESIVNIDYIIAHIDFMANNHSSTRIYVSDRMKEKKEYPIGFELSTIKPIDINNIREDDMRSHLDAIKTRGQTKFLRLLSVPFFLDLYILMQDKGKNDGTQRRVDSRAAMIKEYFIKYLELKKDSQGNVLEVEDEHFILLAEIAFNAYEKGPRFSKEWWEDKLKEDSKLKDFSEKLIGSGIIVESESTIKLYKEFRHQLLHDFLVGYYLTKIAKLEPEMLYYKFDHATLFAKSFEALEFASELLHEKADDFVIEVYDWNYSAALDCILNLESGRSGQDSPISPELKDAIFALIAEKQFDIFENTRNRDSNKFSQFFSSFDIDYESLSMASINELVSEVNSKYLVETRSSGNLYTQWKNLFTHCGEVSISDMAFLQDSPLLAWTAANLFRRLPLSENKDLMEYLIKLFHALSNTQKKVRRAISTRWRIVHILGSVDTTKSIQLLRNALEDRSEGIWVRYGAARSLVELASRQCSAESAREKILNYLISYVGETVQHIARLTIEIDFKELQQEKKVLEELRNVAILREPPTWWKEEYSRFLSEGANLLAQQDPDEKAEWINQISNLQKKQAESEL